MWRLRQEANSSMGTLWSITYGANVGNSTIIQYYVIAALLIGNQASFNSRGRTPFHAAQLSIYVL
jgi:hypothetical protein